MKNIYKHGNRTKKEIALTFDDGPEMIWTEAILSILEKFNVLATFFLIGEKIDTFPKIVRKINDAGHEIGNHGYSHKSLRFCSYKKIGKEILKTEESLQKLAIQTKLFRPAYQRWNPILLKMLSRSSKKMILSDVVPKDFCAKTSDEIVQKILQKTRNGSIIILHDGGGDRKKTVQALEKIIFQLQKRGFHFVTVSELLG